MNPSEKNSLTKLISYQSDSVVSMTIIKKQAGTVTLFAFDKGQALSEHTAPFDALAEIVEGKGEITISGKVFEVSAGEIILMPANAPHAVAAVGRMKMLLTMIRS